MKKTLLFASSIVLFGAGCFTGFGYENAYGYDIKKDYCGKQVPSNRCACAFHGKSCEPGEERAIVNKQLFDDFRAWAKEQSSKE